MKKLLLTTALLTLTNCASMINGTSDHVTINSMEKGSTIYVNGVPRGVDNTTVEVSRKQRHEIRVEKKGCQTMTEQTGRRFDMTSMFGILLDFGIITIPADFIIGGALATSPTTYTVTPICGK